MRWTVSCPAKVNLFLSVGPRDASGMHPIRTVFQAVALFDRLTIDDGVDTTVIDSDWPGLPLENTLSKVLRFATEFVEVPPLHIHLQKQIPDQSGLGGGSTDAAGLLRALGAITHGVLGAQQQLEIARAVGSDVPFFLLGGRAKAEGYGEKLEPLADAPKCWIVIAKPQLGCDTRLAYQLLDQQPRELREFPASDVLWNDFESVAPKQCLELLAELRKVANGDAALSGSGSAVFARFQNKDAAEAAERALKVPGIRTWVVPTLDRAQSSLPVERTTSV